MYLTLLLLCTIFAVQWGGANGVVYAPVCAVANGKQGKCKLLDGCNWVKNGKTCVAIVGEPTADNIGTNLGLGGTPNDEGSHLILHVGPHKTGTSHVQSFINTNAPWIRKTLGIHVAQGLETVGQTLAMKDYASKGVPFALHDHFPGGATQKIPKVGTERASALLDALKTDLSNGGTFLVSAEVFDAVSPAVLEQLASLASRTSFVAVHRFSANVLRSNWEQMCKKTLTNPKAFSAHLVQPALTHQGDAAGKLLDRLHEAASSREQDRVVAVSFDHLADEGDFGLPVFLLCNVSLVTATTWVECKDLVMAKYAEAHYFKFESPPPAMFDVIRLARHAATLLGCSSLDLPDRWYQKKKTPDQIQRLKLAHSLAANLPSTCDGIHQDVGRKTTESLLDSLSAEASKTWAQRTGALLPAHHPVSPICLVEETKLNVTHWKEISALLQDCQRRIE